MRMFRIVIAVGSFLCRFASSFVIERPCCNENPHIPAAFGQLEYEAITRAEIVPVYPSDGCSDLSIVNEMRENSFSFIKAPPLIAFHNSTNSLRGKIALIRRGKCNFTTKVLFAQKANALAAFIMDEEAREDSKWGVIMQGDHNADRVNIPSVFISFEAGQELLAHINESSRDKPVLLTLNTTGQVEFTIKEFGALKSVCLYIAVSIVLFFISSVLCVGSVSLFSWYKRLERTRAAKQLKIHKYAIKKHESENDLCSICLDEFETDLLVKVLPCRHEYHIECIDPWLEERSGRCPICKQNALPEGFLENMVELNGLELSVSEVFQEQGALFAFIMAPVILLGALAVAGISILSY